MDSSETSPVVLLTGCSSGIGRAAAKLFAEKGWRVFASARRVETLRDLPGVTPLSLDVNDHRSIEEAVAAVLSRASRIDVLVNNAGYGQMGPLLTVTSQRLRAQLETNVVAPLALSRAVISGPGGMLERGSGRIVMMSSVVAYLSSPFAGPYCASKAALRSLSDVLRVELRPFGIRVVQVEPGPIRSRFSDNAGENAAHILEDPGPYAGVRPFIERRIGSSQRNAAPTSAAARAIFRAASARRPRTRYTVTVQARVAKALRPFIPDALLDALLAREFGLDETLAREGAAARGARR